MANGEQINQALIRQQRNIRGLAQATQQRQAQAQLEQQQIQQRELVTQQQEAQQLQQQKLQRQAKVVELINRSIRGESVGRALSGLNREQLTEFLRLQQQVAEQRGASQTIQGQILAQQTISDIETQTRMSLSPQERARITRQVLAITPGETATISFDPNERFITPDVPIVQRPGDVVLPEPQQQSIARRILEATILNPALVRTTPGIGISPSVARGRLELGISPGQTFEEIRQPLTQAQNVFVRVGSELIPTTPGGVALTLGGIGACSRIPRVAQLGLETGLVGFGGQQIITGQTQEEIARGILITGLGVTPSAIRGLSAIRPPQFETRILGETVQLGDSRGFGRVAFQTEQRGILAPRQFVGLAESDVRLLGTQGDIQQFVGATRGVAREFLTQLPSGRIAFRRPAGFIGGEAGTISPRELDILLGRIGTREIRGVLPDSSIIRSVGLGTPSGRVSPQFFLSETGVGGLTGDLSLIGGQARFISPTGALQRGGGTFGGVIRRVSPDDLLPSFELTGGQQLTQFQRLALQQQLRQQTVRGFEASLRARVIAQQQRNIQIARTSGGVFATTQFFRPSTTSPMAQITTTETTTVPTTILGTPQRTMELLPSVQKSKEVAGLSERVKENIALSSRSILKTQQRQRARVIGTQGFAQAQTQTPRERLALIQKQLASTVQRQKQLLSVQLSQILARPTARVRALPGLPIIDDISRRIPSGVARLRGNVTPQVKTKGVWGDVGSTTSFKKAKKKMLKNLDNTLSASGRLRTNGLILNIPTLPRGFRKSKVNPLIVVEKRSRRLDSRGETSAIKRAKRRKKK